MLAEPDVAADLIVLTGDLAAGPLPAPTLDRLVALGDGYPDAAAWAEHFVRAEASDADALRVFGPRDGRTCDLHHNPRG